MADCPHVTGDPSGNAGSSEAPKTRSPGPIKADGMMQEKDISGELV